MARNKIWLYIYNGALLPARICVNFKAAFAACVLKIEKFKTPDNG